MQEKLVTFQLAGQVYGLEINSVREIIRLQPVMQVPESPPFVAGVISLRQKTIPVIDLRLRFGFPVTGEDASSRIVIMDIDGLLVGVKVDAVLEVLRMEQADIEPVPPIAMGIDADFLKGIGRWRDKLVLLLDGARLLRDSERQELGKFPPSRQLV